MKKLLAKINIFNENDYLKEIEKSLAEGQKKIFFYMNSQVLYEAQHKKELKENILNVDYLIADGFSIVYAIKKVLNKKIEKVVFTYSYVKFLRDYFIKKHIPIYFLGSTKNNLETAVKKEKKFSEDLIISGYHHGYFDIKTEDTKIIDDINNSNAKVLIVGMGCPRAENWIMTNKDKIQINAIFSVGGFFEFIAKEKIMAPRIFYNSGFEWLFRLLQEPKRLFRRYLTANIYFIYKLFVNR